MPAAIQAATAASKEGESATTAYNSALSAQELASKYAAQAQADYATALRQTANDALDASGAASSYQAAIDDAADAVGEEREGDRQDHGPIDINSEVGRRNKEALDRIAAAALKSTQANADLGAKSADLTAQMATERAEFVATAVNMGMTSEAANKLADLYGLIPGSVKSNVETNAAEAQAQVDALKANIDKMTPPHPSS